MVTKAGAPPELDFHDPAALARYARQRTGADVGIAAALATNGERPTTQYAVDVRDAIERAEGARWNMPLPELRRRAAIESLALLVKTLRQR